MVPCDATLDATSTHVRVRVSGELDIATTPLLQAAISDAQAAELPLIVDLAETSFCDSTGMPVVLRAHRSTQKRGQRFVLVCPSDNREVTRVLELLGCGEVLTVRQTLDEAAREVAAEDAPPNGDAGP